MDAKHYYTKWSLFGGALAGGPVVAGYLLSKNFSLLGDDLHSSYALWGGGITALVAMSILIFMPEEWLTMTVGMAVAGFWPGLALSIYHRFQEDQLHVEVREDLDPAPVWKVAVITILGLIVSILLSAILVVAIILSPLSIPG